MRPAVIVVGAMALLSMVATALLLSNVLTPPPPVVVAEAPAPPPKPKTVSVLVAGSALEVGRTLTADNMEWQEWPEGTVRREQGIALAFVDNEKSEILRQYDGAVLRTAMVRNEPFSDDKVIRPGGGGLLALVLAPGTRSLTIPVTAINGAGGMVQPGDRVDLLLTMALTDPQAGAINANTKEARPRIVTETIERDLKVLARDRSFNPSSAPDAPVPSNITFEVTPQQAESVITAGRIGDFSVIMRPLRIGADPDRVGIPVTTDVQVTPGLQASRRNIPISEIDKSDNPFPRPVVETPPVALPLPGAPPAPPPGAGTITINRWTNTQTIPTMNGKVVDFQNGPAPGSAAAPNVSSIPATVSPSPQTGNVPLQVPPPAGPPNLSTGGNGSMTPSAATGDRLSNRLSSIPSN